MKQPREATTGFGRGSCGPAELRRIRQDSLGHNDYRLTTAEASRNILAKLSSLIAKLEAELDQWINFRINLPNLLERKCTRHAKKRLAVLLP